MPEMARPASPSVDDLAQRPPDPGLARRALPTLLWTVISLPLLVLAVSSVLSWREVWHQAGVETLHAADAAAEYIGRVMDGHRMLVRRLDDLLRARSDNDILRDAPALQAEMLRMVGNHPHAAVGFVVDRSGEVLLSTIQSPAPNARNRADRDYFTALVGAGAPETYVSKVIISRGDGSLFFVFSGRRTNTANGLPPGSFDGSVNVSVHPQELSNGLRQLVNAAGDNIGLARADGEVLAGTRGFTTPPPPLPEGSVRRAMARVERSASVLAEPAGTFPDRLVAVRRVTGWPVFALASRPRAEVVAAWRARMAPQLAVGLPATALLGLLALVVRRQQRSLTRAYQGLETRVAERTAALAASEAEFRATFNSTIIGSAQAELHTLRLTRVNDRFADIIGRDAQALTGGSTLIELGLVEPGDLIVADFCSAVLSNGHYEVEKTLPHCSGPPVWVRVTCAAICDVAAKPLSLIVAVQDITERKLAEERQTLLAREVDHRAKNALAVVQATLRLTPKHDAAAYALAVEGRVGALARAQTLLAGGHWRGTDLRAMVAGELATFLVGGADGAQVRLTGPPVSISAVMTQPLSMALHELATNAVKYGALSAPDGVLEIAWQVNAEILRLDWREGGGPPLLGPPVRAGFGTRLLRATIGQQLGGRADLHWSPSGLHCHIEVPLRRSGAVEAPDGAGRRRRTAIAWRSG